MIFGYQPTRCFTLLLYHNAGVHSRSRGALPLSGSLPVKDTLSSILTQLLLRSHF